MSGKKKIHFIAQTETDIEDLRSGLELLKQQNKELLAELKAQNTKGSKYYCHRNHELDQLFLSKLVQYHTIVLML